MTTTYDIPGPWRGRLAIVARPSGGDWLADDLKRWKTSGIDAIVSALTTSEETELELCDERDLSRKNGIEFISFPIEDRDVPPKIPSVIESLERVERALADGKSVAVHCRQGLGRAPLIAASILVLAGIDPIEAFRRIGQARGVSVPETSAQEQWVRALAHEIAPTRR